MVTLRFDFRDIFRSNRLAFSLQRIWLQFLGLAVGYLGYLVLTYVSAFVSSIKFYDVWQQYGLLPCLTEFDAPWYGWLIYILGILFLLASYLITSTAVSRAAYMVLKGNHFYTWREAFAFAFKKAGAVLFSPFAIAILIVMFLIGALVVGLLGKIPVVGELGFSLFYFLWMIAGLLLVFFVIILTVSIVFSPSIIATTDDDAFEAVFQSFSTFWSQPWRLIIYEALNGALSIAGLLVLAYLVKQAFLLTDGIFAVVMGDKYINIMGQGMYILSSWISDSIVWMESMCGESVGLFYFGRQFLQLEIPAVLNVAAYIFSIMMLIVGAWVFSYGLANFQVGNTLIYLVLRKKKDDENLLEREDREEKEEEEEEKAESEEKKEEEPVVEPKKTRKKTE